MATSDEARFELLDERLLHAADEADLVGLGGHGRSDAHEVRAFLLVERGERDVGTLGEAVDLDELRVGVLGCACADVVAPEEADASS